MRFGSSTMLTQVCLIHSDARNTWGVNRGKPGVKRANIFEARDGRISGLVVGAGAMRADSLVGHIAFAALHAVINRKLAYRTERFVVEGGHAERSPQLLVELAQVFKMASQRRQLNALVSQQELLIAGIPKAGELPLHHNRRQNR